MSSRILRNLWFPVAALCTSPIPAAAQSFLIQCPSTTLTHPAAANAEPAYTGPTTFADGPKGYKVPTGKVNGAVKCQHIAGGDGFANMGDAAQTYLFASGPLSGLPDIM